MPATDLELGEDDPTGRSMGERLHMLIDALDRGDVSAMDGYSTEEMWEAFKLVGRHDEDLESLMRMSEEAGVALLGPYADQDEGLPELLGFVFPEWPPEPEYVVPSHEDAVQALVETYSEGYIERRLLNRRERLARFEEMAREDPTLPEQFIVTERRLIAEAEEALRRTRSADSPR